MSLLRIFSLQLFLFWSGLALSLINVDSLRITLNHSPSDKDALSSRLEYLKTLQGNETNARIILSNWILEEALKIEEVEIAATAFNEAGLAYLGIADYEKASLYLKNGLRLAEHFNLHHIEFKLLNSLADLYNQLNLSAEAIRHLKLAITQGQKSPKTESLPTAYLNLAAIYAVMTTNEDTLNQAILLNRYAWKLCSEQTVPDSTVIILSIGSIASIYAALGIYDSAMHYFDLEQKLIGNAGYETIYAHSFLRRGYAYLDFREEEKAVEYCLKALDYSEKYHIADIKVNCYDALAFLYKTQGDYKNAYLNNRKYTNLGDSLMDILRFENTLREQKKYEYEKNEREIQHLKRQNEIRKLQLEKNESSLFFSQILIGFTISFVLVLSFLIWLLIKSGREKLITNDTLIALNEDIRNRSETLIHQSRLISKFTSQMNPHFIYNAIHTIQGIVLKGHREETLNQLENFAELMRSTLKNSESEHITITEEINYLKKYICFEQSKFGNRLKFKIETDLDPDETMIPPMLIQPFIENAVKHGGLNLLSDPEIHLVIRHNGNNFQVSVYDNGRGFDVNQKIQVEGSHAISIFKSRLELIWSKQGKLFQNNFLIIRSRPEIERGTEVVFLLPIKYKY